MNPYESLSDKAFWSPAVAQKNMFDISGLWNPGFKITKNMKTVTFGSCFAQHFGKALKQKGFAWYSAEEPPFGMSSEDAKVFNYNVFSARTGNIYTTSLLLQWVNWAIGEQTPPENCYWEKSGRYFDPFRPNVEPNGFESIAEMEASRNVCIESFSKAIEKSQVFVFTLGLTESWWKRDENTGGLSYEYPICPGAIAGDFDSSRHAFVNQNFEFVRDNLLKAIYLMRRVNNKLKFLLTVSPVPLTATNSGQHVLVATSYSKSVLRAVAGAVVMSRKGVDYFPSYEIINSFPYRGVFFEPNMRSVNKKGVSHVMSMFFSGLSGAQKKSQFSDLNSKHENEILGSADEYSGKRKEDVVCEEELLDAFSKRSE